MISTAVDEGKSESAEIAELLEAGQIHPVIGRAFALEEMPDAHRYIA